MTRCRPSENVCLSLKPSPAQVASDSGSVATIREYRGASVRACPASDGVKPSVARTTTSARTSPRSVRTTPGSIPLTAVCSWITPPRRSTARASPRTRRAGCTTAQWGGGGV